MPAGVGLARLVDASAILSAEQQAFVAAQHADDAWSVDPSAGTVTLTAPEGRTTVCRAHLLGTSAPGPGTWLWAWRNINGFPSAFVALAERVRAAGESQGVAELTTAELPLDEALPRRLAIAAKTVTGIAAHYSGPVGGGSRAWLLLEHPDLVLRAPATRTAMEAILAAVGSVDIRDHAEALASWARQRGVTVAPGGPDGLALRLSLPDGQLLVVLDDRGRIGRVETEQPVGPDASATLHGDAEPPLDAGEVATEAIDLPVLEPPPGPEPEPERMDHRQDGDEDERTDEHEGSEEEGPVRRLFGFLRGPRP